MLKKENDKMDQELEEQRKLVEELKPPAITFEEFLENKPPDEIHRISNLLSHSMHSGLAVGRRFNTPP